MPRSLLASEIGHPLTVTAAADASDAKKLPYLRLGCALLYKSIKDLRHEDDQTALSALMWLCLDEMPRMVLELLEFETSSPAELIGRGLPDIPGRQPGRKQYKKYKFEG